MQPSYLDRKQRQRQKTDFWKFWAGQTLSNLGSSFTVFALPLLVYQITGSALNLGLTTVASVLPYLLFGLVIGAWTDRLNRKQVMIVTDIARAIVIGSIPLMASFGLLSIWWIYGVAFVQQTLTIFFDSSQFAVVPSLVNQDDLVKANGRLEASYSGASILGPFLAGLLLAVVAVPALMLIDAASFLVSAFSLLLIQTSFTSHKPQEQKRISQDVLAGLRYVMAHPILRNISLMMVLYNFVSVTAGTELVLFAQQQLNATATQIGWLYSAASIGIVVFALIAGSLRKRWSFSSVALSALFLEGTLTIAFALIRWYWADLVLWTLTSGLGVLFNINTRSLRQAIVPKEMLGRVSSIARVLAWSSAPIGALVGGLFIQWFHSAEPVYVAIGVLSVVIPAVFSFTALGHAERYLSHNEETQESKVETTS